MAFKNFSSTQYIRYMDTGEIVKLGGFQVVEPTELAHIRVVPMVFGTLAGLEQIRLNIYSDPGLRNKLFHSDWRNVRNLVNESGTEVNANWFGVLRMDFNRQNINKNFKYYIGAESSAYTADFSTLSASDTFFIGFARDYPFPRYAAPTSVWYETNLAFEIYGYK